MNMTPLPAQMRWPARMVSEPVAGTRRCALIYRLPVDALEYAPTREAAMVGEMAEAVHAQGYAFDGWPRLTRRWIGLAPHNSGRTEMGLPEGNPRAFCVELRATVTAVPRE